MPPKPKPRAPPRPNPISGRNRPPPSKNPTIFTERAKVRPPKPACVNPDCRAPNIEDGTCLACGWVIDDSNIVAEIQFGESSSGAAIVQGTFLGADQGGSRSQGMPGQRGNGGNSKQTLEDGTLIMKSIAAQLSIRESTVKDAIEVFKLAQSENFIQGRRISEVAAVSLYVSCRRNPPCKVMLIEFSDKINVNVFRLGRVFSDLQEKCCLSRQLLPVVPEDLMRRFALKLEFGDDLDKVCESAIRFCNRMELDWIAMGRRPSGICGAALVLAARMHNYRRTLKEVVYVVKITSATLQKRLVEFMRTASSKLTLEEFSTTEFLSTQHDPPSFYQNSPEFLSEKERKKNKKRKRTGPVLDEEELLEAEQEKRRESERALEQENRRDADGFAIPAIPSSSRLPRPNFDKGTGANVDPDLQSQEDLVDHALHNREDLDTLVNTFDEELRPEEKERQQQEEQEKRDENRRQEEARKSGLAPSTRGTLTDTGSGAMRGTVDGLNALLSQILMDPHSLEGALHHAEAEERVKHRMIIARENEKHVNMDVDIGEDEFDDDPDVANSILSPEDVARKERVWLNANKAWLLKEQKKKHDAELALQQPPVKKRNRVKKAKMGEGQTEPANSPGEATNAVADNRGFSKKVNYNVFSDRPAFGSRAGSIFGSVAGSERGSEPPSGREDTVEPRAPSVAVENVSREPTRSPSRPVESEADERVRPANSPEADDEDVEMVNEEVTEVVEESEEEYQEEEEYQDDAGYNNDDIPDINVRGYDDDDD